jgi:predicted component of type VI protein secretion system
MAAEVNKSTFRHYISEEQLRVRLSFRDDLQEDYEERKRIGLEFQPS